MTNDIVQMQIPLWGTGSEWFWAFCQFIAVALTLVFIWIQIWQQTKQLKIQTASHVVETVCTIQERWNSETMQRVRLSVCSRWKNNNREFDGACEYIAEFIEELATFVENKAVPEKIMWDVQSWNVECYWPMFKDGIEKLRDEYKDNTLYTGFQNLFDAMSEISKKEGASPKNPKDISDFIEREIRSTNACIEIKKGSGYYQNP